MKRATIAAQKAYPKEDSKMWHSAFGTFEFDKNAQARKAYQEGYEQAAKDIALTIEDLELLHTFLYAVKNNKQGCFTFTRLSGEQYEEVLRRFNAQRK